jgi:hypothetical protein
MTMNHKVLDLKLKRLIMVCKETGNYKKLAVVGFTLVSNLIDEIALKLGTRPREKENGESILKYVYMINEVFDRNLHIHIFQEDVIETIKDVELLFLRNRGDLPLEYIKRILNVYYELRKVEVPNVYKSLTGEGYFDDSNLHLFSTGLRTKKDKSSKFKPILLQKISEQERTIQRQLNDHLEQGSLEKAIVLKNMRLSLNKEKGFTMQGSLKDSLDFQTRTHVIVKFMLIGLAMLSFLLGVIIITEIVLYPLTISALSSLLLIFFGVCVVIIYIYKNVFRRRQ